MISFTTPHLPSSPFSTLLSAQPYLSGTISPDFNSGGF
ncbi:hypothetical protein SLEP1_g54412 [Rubroshorea leprosula]|uniref:Uncharacterized protein n=1 Tax=Rubroshorea leprosula TaxID=152421 RepID=A0AAV5MCA6_9ROSI|nr:hypothetical protein SLEP1_g54412 [Rubroshorea leprosula]